jgi:hypothetical protein
VNPSPPLSQAKRAQRNVDWRTELPTPLQLDLASFRLDRLRTPLYSWISPVAARLLPCSEELAESSANNAPLPRSCNAALGACSGATRTAPHGARPAPALSVQFTARLQLTPSRPRAARPPGRRRPRRPGRGQLTE